MSGEDIPEDGNMYESKHVVPLYRYHDDAENIYVETFWCLILAKGSMSLYLIIDISYTEWIDTSFYFSKPRSCQRNNRRNWRCRRRKVIKVIIHSIHCISLNLIILLWRYIYIIIIYVLDNIFVTNNI